MACVSAEELQARLALRALWAPAQASDSGANDGAIPPVSEFHRNVRSELDDILKASLNRRRARLEQKVSRLIEGGSASQDQENMRPAMVANGSSPSSSSLVSAEAQTNSTGSQDYWMEERRWGGQGDKAPTERLAESFEKAFLHACKSTWPPVKKWGPSRRQNNFEDPPVKEEKLEKEATTMRATMQSLNQNLNSRVRQIKSLKAQLTECQRHFNLEDEEVRELDKTLLAARDPLKLPAVKESRLKQRKQAYEKVEQDLELAKADAARYQALVKQQHAFFMQAESIYMYDKDRGGNERLNKFPAGELFLVPQPLPMDEEKGTDSWDVGTFIANPYEVDSWPFEANVLARRTPKECAMENVAEETLEDLMEAQRPGRTNPFSGPGLNLRGMNNADDSDDDAGGPSATSRSL